MLLGIAGVIARRRRGNGGVEPVDRPIEPVIPDPVEMEAELHEMIAEARARELLAPGEASETR